MKRIILASLVILMTLVVSIVAHMPAQFVLKFAPMPRALSIQGVQGSVWQGSANQVSWQGTSLGQLQWNIHPSQLLMGSAQAEVRFGQGSTMGLRGQGVVGYRFSGVYAKDTIASIPAQYAVDQLALPLPLDLGGQIELSISDLTVTGIEASMPSCQQATGALVWSGSEAITPIAQLDVGPVVVDIGCDAGVISLNGAQQSRQVSAQFETKLEPQQNGRINYQVTGWFKPEADFPTNLSSQLKWLGNPDSQGRYPQRFQGVF